MALRLFVRSFAQLQLVDAPVAAASLKTRTSSHGWSRVAQPGGLQHSYSTSLSRESEPAPASPPPLLHGDGALQSLVPAPAPAPEPESSQPTSRPSPSDVEDTDEVLFDRAILKSPGTQYSSAAVPAEKKKSRWRDDPEKAQLLAERRLMRAAAAEKRAILKTEAAEVKGAMAVAQRSEALRSETKSRAEAAKAEEGPQPPPPLPPKPKSRRISSTKKREEWAIYKDALRAKFLESGGWKPRKKLSPDALEGIRALHRGFPEQFPLTTLAGRFKVSPEAMRRILKSSWEPSAEEEADRQMRWLNRGKDIWARWAALGKKPPRAWREMGIRRKGPPRGRGIPKRKQLVMQEQKIDWLP